MADENDENGESESRIRPEDALRAFFSRDDYAEPLDAKEIREHPGVGWPHSTAHKQLQELEETGKVKARKVGAHGKVWWIPLERERVGVEALPPESNPFPASVDQIIDYFEQIDEKTPTESSAEVVLSAYFFLQTREGAGATTSELREHCRENHPGEKDEEGVQEMWKRSILPFLPHLPGVGGPPGRGGGRWNFVDPFSEIGQALDCEIDNWVYERVELSSQISELTAERERALVQLAYEFLKREGAAQRSEIEGALPSYVGHYDDFGGVWQYLIAPALENACDETRRRNPGSPIFVYDPDDGSGAETDVGEDEANLDETAIE